MELLQNELVEVINKKNDCAGDIAAQMIQLKVVQGEVSRLIHKLDEITFNKWHEDKGMAYFSILEIADKVRLIDMAFRPLFKELSEEVGMLVNYTELFDKVMKEKMSV